MADDLRQCAHALRKTILRMNHAAGSGHTGGSLSCVEILTVLYERILDVRPEAPLWPLRDRFVLSKGHAAPALYATLARKGFFEPALLSTLRRTGSLLQGHPLMKIPGVDMSTGSLGMGLSVALGMALARDLLGQTYRVTVLCGDGELDEGQNWEAFMALAKWRPIRFLAIIDRNHVQLDGPEAEVMPLGDLDAKLSAFGIDHIRCDGHDVVALESAMKRGANAHAPCVVVAETVKGKGVSFMEHQAAWHGRPIDEASLARAMAELEQR